MNIRNLLRRYWYLLVLLLGLLATDVYQQHFSCASKAPLLVEKESCPCEKGDSTTKGKEPATQPSPVLFKTFSEFE